MRTRTVFLIAMLAATVALPEAASAQFSPQGLLNGMTRPFRSILGRLGHFPHNSRHREAAADRQGAEPAQQGDGRLGRVGPDAWPTAYEDVIGFAFWPDEYAPRLRGHGFDVIADTIAGRTEPSRRPAQVATTGSAIADSGGACQDTTADAATDAATWPSTRLSQTVQLADAQHDAVDKMQTSVNQSAAAIKTNCPDPNAQTGPDRLGTLVQTLWSVRDAGQALRVSIKDFDASLNQSQKASFASQASQAPQETPKPDARNQNPATQNPTMNRMYQACAQPNVEEAERFIKLIELRMRPNKEQALRLENLHKVSSDMAKLLMASCAKPIPADPVARLDAADDQLAAMNYAATTVQIAFNDFYAALDNRQKAMFDSSGR